MVCIINQIGKKGRLVSKDVKWINFLLKLCNINNLFFKKDPLAKFMSLNLLFSMFNVYEIK